MHPTPITDEQLASRLQNGDEQAIAMIYERFKHGLFRFCMRLVSESEIAEDIVQETFVRMIDEKMSLHNPAALKSWMYMIARNEAFTQLKKRKRTRMLFEDDQDVFIEESTSDSIETAERSAIITSFVNRLLPQYKEVLVLREYEAMNYEEIAEVIGASVATVKSRLFRARKALSEKLLPLRKASDL
ncbi:MAG: RNA polymerase sigma factor [Bacteroidota bacterium]|jgi:RNA polymerase sigma-70 factor (ECF subfamily)